MTNQEKYKTAEERIKAFDDFCKGQGDRCNHCEIARKRLSISRRSECVVYWLAIEAEEKPGPCPFCESSCTAHKGVDMVRPHVSCDNEWCGYRSTEKPTIEDAIAAHNRVCHAVEAMKKGVK